MAKVVVIENGQQISLEKLRERRLKRSGANRLNVAPKPLTFDHPAAATLFQATRQLAEQARTLASLSPDDLSHREVQDDFLEAAQEVHFAQARQAVRNVYHGRSDAKIIGLTLKGARETSPTELAAIKRIILTAGQKGK